MKAEIAVLPHARVSSNTQSFVLRNALEVFHSEYETDAHAIAYSYPDKSPTPRLRLGNLSELITAEKEPVLNWIFIDVDNPDHESWTAEEAEEHWKYLKQSLDLAELESAIFYSTRGGYRLVFLLETPIPVSIASDYITQFSSYLNQKGIPVDEHCVQRWNTIFRLPKVTRDGKLLKAYIDSSGISKPLSWAAPIPLSAHISPPNIDIARQKRPPLRPLGDLGWSVISTCKDSLDGQFEALKKGDPIASKGARQSTMFNIAAKIIGKLELNEPDLAYQALAESVVAGGGISLDDLWDRCCYLVELDKAKRLAKEELQERVESNQPPIVYHGQNYYIYDTTRKTYRPHVTSPAVCQALEQWCRIPGLQTRTRSGKPRSVSEYLADYGRQAVDVVVEMGRARGVYLPEMNGGTLIDGCCKATNIVPIEDKYIARWLELLGGKYHSELLDWIATAAQLDRPTCALYLEGPKGTGKGMFASGIASLWGCGATSYADATGRFNGALTKNPVVLVDEVSQTFDGGEGFSGAFRTLVGESTRQLRRKNQPSSTIRGCPRLIVTANNPDALKLTENLTKNDLEAIAERILHLKHNESAAAFLAYSGGRDFTSDWVLKPDGSPGKIASHAAWLAKTRSVNTSGRFLVSGVLADWHRDLMGNSGIQGAVLAALAHYIDRARPIDGISVDKGMVYVNMPILRKQWGLLMGDNPPREGVLANALKTLAGGKQSRIRFNSGRLRCYCIELSDVTRRAEALHIGDVEKFEIISKGKNPDADEKYPSEC